MHVSYSRWERRDTTSREELGQAAIRLCRAQRTANAKVQAARYFWVDAGNTIVVLVEGEPGFADFNPEPEAELARAQFALSDVARQVGSELWTDPRLGLDLFDRAGRPTGIAGDCPICDGIGQVPMTDVGGGSATIDCPSCGGTGRAAVVR